ncbi:MAG: ATP-binding protein [Oscillospiraceae bacterium]|nr:ATP-binding protein [Oscillospiraceae bacterium]
MKELTIEATPENIDTVIAFVDEQLEEYGCGMREQMAIDVAVDELFANIAQYAYSPDTGYATVRVDVLNDPLSVEVTFIDNGKQYDPLAKEDPDTTLSVEDRPIGGMGILIVKRSMDTVNYEYKDGKNILTIKKNLQSEE